MAAVVVVRYDSSMRHPAVPSHLVLTAAASVLTACAFSGPASDKAASGADTASTSGSMAAGSGALTSGRAGSSGTAVPGGGSSGGAESGTTATAPPGTTGTVASSDEEAGNDLDAGTTSDETPDTSNDSSTYADWLLSWSDEFNDEAGTPPNSQYWSYDLGGGGWGIGQLQVYTNQPANAETDGLGNLQMTVIEDNQGNFTSARIKTQNKFQQAYGRFEIRAKVVTGNGMWPAFWMLGDNYDSAGWPQCGEIDIMEVRGSTPWTNGGSMHGPGYSGMHPLSKTFSLPEGGPKLSDDFHIYAIEWEVNVVRFYVDSNLYETETPADIPNGAGPWVYDHPFFILVNLAVGGSPPWGPPTGTVFPQTMLVDYIRVYERPDAGQ
jgi:beta-glucanase (GH16 family)